MNFGTFYNNATTPDALIGSYDIKNLVVIQQISAGALTLSLKTKNLNTPNFSDKGTIAFPTAATGACSSVDVTSATSLTVPSGATLGVITFGTYYLYLWAINNGGTVELAISGSRIFEDGSTQSTTAITSGSTSASVLYSTSARSSKSIRLVAILVNNQPDTLGVYSVPLNILQMPQKLPALTGYISDVKANNTAGGTFISGSYQTRALLYPNVGLVDNIYTFSGNQFILTAGTYLVNFVCPAFNCNAHKAKLRNITASSDLLIGTSELATTTAGDQTYSIINGTFTLTTTTTIEVQHRCATTANTSGFGRLTNFGVQETYTSGTITRIR